MKTKILIAEDTSITGMDLWHLLELWGYELCEQVTSGEEAVLKAEQEGPDIIIMDIGLDGSINGIEAAEEIHERFGIPVIFITGYSDEKTRAKAEAVKPAGFFVKPLDYYKLKSAIEEIAEKRMGNIGSQG